MKYAAVILLITAAGCASISNPFVHMKPDYTAVPAEALREAALEIEKAVQNGERQPEIANREGIVVNDATVMQAIRMRAARIGLVNELLEAGHAVEARNGTVSIIRNKDYKRATTRRQRDRNALVVMNENSDRWTLYEGLLKASRFPRRSLSAIQACFHGARVAVMAPGQAYEDAGGQIIVKKP